MMPESLTENEEKRRLPWTPSENQEGCCLIKERITQALRHFKESTERHVLAQFWAPVKNGDQCLLTTSGQPLFLIQVVIAFISTGWYLRRICSLWMGRVTEPSVFLLVFSGTNCESGLQMYIITPAESTLVLIMLCITMSGEHWLCQCSNLQGSPVWVCLSL